MKRSRSKKINKKRKRRRATQPPVETREDPIVGWFASEGLGALCDGDACVIAGSRSVLDKMIARTETRPWRIRTTTYNEILWGLRQGAAYAFDQKAYEVVLPLAQQDGLPLEEQDLSDPGPTGVHLLRVQFVPLGPLFG